MMVAATRTGERYTPPSEVRTSTLAELLGDARAVRSDQQHRLRLVGADEADKPIRVFYAGDPTLVRRPCVAVVGSRKSSNDGLRRAARVARELAREGVVIVSGLAAGVDGAAHRAAIEAGGKTIAVLGTPLDEVTPKAHAALQETICREHLAISQFPAGSRVFPSNFPQRNKIMAAITDATVIVEASDTSGTLHQAAECTRLDRWLFITRSVFDNPALKWPGDFKKYHKTRALDRIEDILSVLR